MCYLGIFATGIRESLTIPGATAEEAVVETARAPSCSGGCRKIFPKTPRSRRGGGVAGGRIAATKSVLRRARPARGDGDPRDDVSTYVYPNATGVYNHGNGVPGCRDKLCVCSFITPG